MLSMVESNTTRGNPPSMSPYTPVSGDHTPYLISLATECVCVCVGGGGGGGMSVDDLLNEDVLIDKSLRFWGQSYRLPMKKIKSRCYVESLDVQWRGRCTLEIKILKLVRFVHRITGRFTVSGVSVVNKLM